MKVRVNSVYRYNPVLMDLLHKPYGQPEVGQLLRVVNLHGCPRANTMGHCHVVDAASGAFMGLICCNSLEKTK